MSAGRLLLLYFSCLTLPSTKLQPTIDSLCGQWGVLHFHFAVLAYPSCRLAWQKVSVGSSSQFSSTNTLRQGWDTQVLCAGDQRAAGLLRVRWPPDEVSTGWPKGFVLIMVTILTGPSMGKFWMWTGEVMLSHVQERSHSRSETSIRRSAF